MQLKIILLIGVILLLPSISVAEEATSSEPEKIESMTIQTLIEKAKEASSTDRAKIEDIIKKKIAQAHRANYIKR